MLGGGGLPGLGPRDPVTLSSGWSLGARQAPGKGCNLQELEKSEPYLPFLRGQATRK